VSLGLLRLGHVLRPKHPQATKPRARALAALQHVPLGLLHNRQLLHSHVTMTPTQTHYTLLTAEQFGGSFIRHLAVAALHADPSNRKRVLTAFPEIEAEYGPTSKFYSEALG